MRLPARCSVRGRGRPISRTSPDHVRFPEAIRGSSAGSPARPRTTASGGSPARLLSLIALPAITAHTEDGADKLTDLGINVDGALAGPRTPIRYCVDWSEQDHHLSGALGAALAVRLFDLGWVKRLPRTRAVLVTDEGRRSLAEHIAVALD